MSAAVGLLLPPSDGPDTSAGSDRPAEEAGVSAAIKGDDLATLAAQINVAIRRSARSAMEQALEIGRLLTEAKRHVEHGGWHGWLSANCVVAPRTARVYMFLVKRVPLLPPEERQRVADLPVREAVRAITTKPDRPAPRPRSRVVSAPEPVGEALQVIATEPEPPEPRPGSPSVELPQLAERERAIEALNAGHKALSTVTAMIKNGVISASEAADLTTLIAAMAAIDRLLDGAAPS